MPTTMAATINGLDLQALQGLVNEIKADHRRGLAHFDVTTRWQGAMGSRTRVDGWSLGGRKLPQSFEIPIDEPRELLGRDASPNPQEYLLAAMNACMLNTFVAACSLMGVTLQSVELQSEGELDLRGFLGLDPSVKPGYDSISYTIRVKGDGTREQYAKAHEAMKATSPNYFNIANAITLNSRLVVE